MSVQVELILRIRDDADEHPYTETTACVTEAADAVEGMITAFMDVMLRCGFAHGTMLHVCAEVVDVTIREGDFHPSIDAAEENFRSAAEPLVNAWREYKEARAAGGND